jgi:hypothetical protein
VLVDGRDARIAEQVGHRAEGSRTRAVGRL